MKLAVGCPVFERGWVLDRWFDSLEAQGFDDYRCVFVYTPGRDDTLEVIRRRAPDAEVVVADDLRTFGNEHRGRDVGRYDVLAELRNRMLWVVRQWRPERFLSWDSDVIFPPGTLGRLVAHDVSAVGALIDMHGNNSLMTFPSAMHWADYEFGRGARHYRPEQVFDWSLPRPVPVIMAVKAMAPAVYGTVDYAPHPQGEDVGWALRCEEAGLSRWIEPRCVGRHLTQADRPMLSPAGEPVG